MNAETTFHHLSSSKMLTADFRETNKGNARYRGSMSPGVDGIGTTPLNEKDLRDSVMRDQKRTNQLKPSRLAPWQLHRRG